MAAIIEPRRIPASPRPALRLVSAHDGRAVGAPVDLGLSAAHVAAAIAAIVVAMVLALAIGNGALAGLAPGGPEGAAPAAAAAASTEGTSVTARAGDTLWSIAREMQPTGDVRPLVDRLLAANGSAPLQAGQEIIVPG